MKRLLQSTFARQASTLSIGSMVGIGVGLLSSPIVSRLYGPDDFYHFGIYMALLAILLSGSTLKFEWAIVVAKTDAEAAALFRLCLLFGAALAALSAAIVIPLILSEQLHLIFAILPPAILAYNINQGLEHRANRAERYGLITQARIAMSLTNPGVKIGLAPTALHPIALALSEALAFAASALTLRLRVPAAVPAAPLAGTASSYRRFPLYSAPASVLNTAASRIEYLLLIAVFPVPILGAYYFWNRLIDIPKTFLTTSIWQVFLRETADLPTAEIGRRKDPRQRALIDLTITPYVCGALLVPSFAGPVFGPEWADYGHIAVPLVFASHLNLCVSGFSLFVPLKQQGKELWFNLGMGLAKSAAVLAAAATLSQPIHIVWALAAVHALVFFFLGDWYHHMLGRAWTTFTRNYLLAFLLRAALPLIALLAVQHYSDHIGLHLLAFIVLAGSASAIAARHHLNRVPA